MENNKNYFLVGLFVIGSVVAALLFTVWLTSAAKGDYVHYRIRFSESVSGLSIGGLVKFRGVNVGSVESIEIDQVNTNLIVVGVKVEKETPIKTDTVASLKLQGVTGIVFIELTGGSNNAQNLSELSRRGHIPEIKAKSSQLAAIVDKLPELVDQVSKTIANVNKLVSDENVANISSMITEWEKISLQLSESIKQIDPMIQNGNQFAADMREITNNSKDSIKETLTNLNQSSQQLDSLMRDMKKTSRNISNLSESLNEDPSRLIFPDEQKGVPAP